jgi:hypothetical protein
MDKIRWLQHDYTGRTMLIDLRFFNDFRYGTQFEFWQHLFN